MQVLIECNCLGSDDMLQRSTLLSWEYGRVEQHTHLLHLAFLGSQTPRIIKVFTHQDDTTTRTTESLVCSRSNDVGILQWIIQQTSSNQTSRVSHINHQQGAYLISNFAHAGIIPLTAIGTTTTDDQLRFVLKSQFLHFVVINSACLFVEVVTDRVVENTRSIDVATMRKVTTVVEIQSHESIARFENSEQNGSISLCSRVRLNIGILSTEDFLDTLDGKVLYDINNLATAIVTFARETFCILVGQV